MCTGVASYHIFLFSVYLTLFEQDFFGGKLESFFGAHTWRCYGNSDYVAFLSISREVSAKNRPQVGW